MPAPGAGLALLGEFSRPSGIGAGVRLMQAAAERSGLTTMALDIDTPGRAVPPAGQSAFSTQADWLKTATDFEGVFPQLVINGETFTGTTFHFAHGDKKP